MKKLNFLMSLLFAVMFLMSCGKDDGGIGLVPRLYQNDVDSYVNDENVRITVYALGYETHEKSEFTGRSWCYRYMGADSRKDYYFQTTSGRYFGFSVYDYLEVRAFFADELPLSEGENAPADYEEYPAGISVEAHFVQYTANELQIQLSIVEKQENPHL